MGSPPWAWRTRSSAPMGGSTVWRCCGHAELWVARPAKTALVSSLRGQSAVLLDMVATIDPTIPAIFVDTGKLFAATHAYRDTWSTCCNCATSAWSGRRPRSWRVTIPGDVWLSLDRLPSAPVRWRQASRSVPVAGAGRTDPHAASAPGLPRILTRNAFACRQGC